MAIRYSDGPTVSWKWDGGLSPRVYGKLVLRANQLSYLTKSIRGFLFEGASQLAKGNASVDSYIEKCRDSISRPSGLYNAVFDAFQRGVYEDARASLAVDAAEASETAAFLKTSARKLAQAAYLIRKGKLGRAAAVLGLVSIPRRARRAKPFSENWLAFHFGWAPIVGSMYSAAITLSNPIQRRPFIRKSRTGYVPNVYFYNNTSLRVLADGIKWRCTIASQVVVKNPLLAAAEQWGVANPLAIAWALMPFSFVVDWFANVGKWLGGVTSFLGLDLINASVTDTRSCYVTQTKKIWHQNKNQWVLFNGNANFVKSRTIGPPPTPSLELSTAGFGLWNLITTGTLMSTIFSGGSRK